MSIRTWDELEAMCGWKRPQAEFTDEQCKRIDEITDAAYTFLKVLAETDDIPEDIAAIWNVVYAGMEELSAVYGRRTRIPTRVTEKDGRTYIVDYDDEINSELGEFEKDHHQ